MIKVTLGEKPKEEKPFPKLMKSESGQIFYAIMVNKERDDLIVGFLLHADGYPVGEYGFSERLGRHLLSDFDSPITLQNA